MKMLLKIIDITTIIFGTLLGLRVTLMALGANIEAPFVKWIYEEGTGALMQPFVNIFPTPTIGTKGIADLPAFFAILVYIGIGYALSTGLESLANSFNIKSPIKTMPKSKEIPPMSGITPHEQATNEHDTPVT